jgi:hypothetical protein
MVIVATMLRKFSVTVMASEPRPQVIHTPAMAAQPPFHHRRMVPAGLRFSS